MISTVTTATISTVTTVTIAGSLALVSVLTLLGLLLQKELTTASDSRLARALGRALTIGIIPLLMAFLMIAAFRIYHVLK
mgnify:FL=1